MEGPSKGSMKGAWTAQEDSLLRQCIDTDREGKWHQVPLRAGLNRCRKSCRIFSSDEDDLLLRLHKLLGNRWSLIAGRLPGKTADDVKNYWNIHLSKKYEPSKKKKTNISFSPTAPAKKIDVLKPRPRSFLSNETYSRLIGPAEVDIISPCHGLNYNSVCENSVTCNKNDLNEEKETMWWGSLLQKSENTYALIREDAAGEKGTTSAFDIEQLWSLFDGETVELD